MEHRIEAIMILLTAAASVLSALARRRDAGSDQGPTPYTGWLCALAVASATVALSLSSLKYKRLATEIEMNESLKAMVAQLQTELGRADELAQDLVARREQVAAGFADVERARKQFQVAMDNMERDKNSLYPASIWGVDCDNTWHGNQLAVDFELLSFPTRYELAPFDPSRIGSGARRARVEFVNARSGDVNSVMVQIVEWVRGGVFNCCLHAEARSGWATSGEVLDIQAPTGNERKYQLLHRVSPGASLEDILLRNPNAGFRITLE